jgi:plastocyanin
MKVVLNLFFQMLLITVILATAISFAGCAPSPAANTPVTSTPPAVTPPVSPPPALPAQTTSTPVASTPSPASNAVTISNFAFSPENLTVKTGTTVTWTNKDSAPHTVTSDNGVFNSPDMLTNATFSFTFSSAGIFSYHCAIHKSMKGTITVQ